MVWVDEKLLLPASSTTRSGRISGSAHINYWNFGILALVCSRCRSSRLILAMHYAANETVAFGRSSTSCAT